MGMTAKKFSTWFKIKCVPCLLYANFNLENLASNVFCSPVSWSFVIVSPIACFVPQNGYYSFKLNPEIEKEEREAVTIFATSVQKHRDKTLGFTQLVAFSLQRKTDEVVSLLFKLVFHLLIETEVLHRTVASSSRTKQLFSKPKHQNTAQGTPLPPNIVLWPTGQLLARKKTEPHLQKNFWNSSKQQTVLLFNIIHSFHTCKQLAC